MKLRNCLLAVGVLVAAVLVVGCSGGSTPKPSSDSSGSSVSPSTTGKTLPYAGAPKVEHPLPESVLSGHPCDGALTAAQINAIFKMQPQGVRADIPALGPECKWVNEDTGSLVLVLYTTKADGLSAVYANTKGMAKVWRPLPPVQGLPAVAHSTAGDQRQNDSCQVSVGITDRYTVDVSVGLGQSRVGKQDPCDAAATVAGMVVTNLKQKAGA